MKRNLSILFLLFLLACGHKAPPPGKPDLDGPEVKILYPLEGDTIWRDTTVVVDAIDRGSRVALVEIYLNGVKKATDSLEPYEFPLYIDSLQDTVYSLRAKAKDVWDNWGSSPIIRFHVVHLKGEGKDGENKED